MGPPPGRERKVFMRSAPARVVVLSLFLVLLSSMVLAQVAGQNIDMVSGTSFPGGDPFLQRQNEPSIAVSTRNPQHLLAGANDYRTVDVPFDPDTDDEKKGDAWAGIFKSSDGGNSWTSTLLPGFPQDNSPQGINSPIHGYQAASDIVVRAGTNGLFYVSGIAFNRSNNASVVFLARFIDNNNNETGDSISYIDTRIVATPKAGFFLDKPWLAVDVPRSAVPTLCTIPQTQVGNVTVPAQSIRAGNVYVAYHSFDLSMPDGLSDVVVARSTNCGVTWQGAGTNAIPISQPNTINQGASLAIDPTLGTVYVTWRQFAQHDTQP